MGSSDFDGAQRPEDIGGRLSVDRARAAEMYTEEQAPRSRTSSSQSRALQAKYGTSGSLHDPNLPPPTAFQHGRPIKDKKASGGSLKKGESGKAGGRHQQKGASKKAASDKDKSLRRSESFRAASQEGTTLIPQDQGIGPQRGNISEYQLRDQLADSDLDRMVLPPPPPLNIERGDLQFAALQMGEQGEPLQMPPPSFTTDGVMPYHGYPQQPLQAAQPPSPLAVVRSKRASQASWEKKQKSSLERTTEKDVTLGKSIFQGNYTHRKIIISSILKHTTQKLFLM